MARGFKIADAYVDIHADKASLRQDVRDLGREAGPEADRAGQQVGDKVSDGMGKAMRRSPAIKKGVSDGLKGAEGDASKGGSALGNRVGQGFVQGFVRNSPIIVAAISGALIAGAPLVATAAVGMFAGLGIVAAAQSERVKSAWLGTWQSISAGTEAAARPIEDVLVGLSARVEARFQRLAPTLGTIFTAAAPQIDVFADGLMDLVENVLPGFQRAVERGMPVTMGFASFLEKTGTGMTGMLDGISEHSAASGAVLSMLGDTFGALLPLIGELLGQGAELATVVLPLLNGSLGAVLDVVQVLGPILPAVAAGFLAWKIVGTVTPMLSNFAGSMTKYAENLAFASYQNGAFAGSAGRMSTAASGIAKGASAMGAALPVAAVGLALVAANFTKVDNDARNAARAMIDGGKAARQAQEDIGASIAGMDAGWVDGAEKVQGWTKHFGPLGQAGAWAFDLISTTSEEAGEATESAYQKMLDAMTPLQRAQQDVTYWTNEVKSAISDSSYEIQDQDGKAVSLATAQGNLADAERKAAEMAREHEQAIKGVTEAMNEQVDQARARVDANFAYEDSLNGVEDAQAALAEAQAHLNDADEKTRTSQEDVSRAVTDLNKALDSQVEAAGRVASSNLPASMDDAQKAILGAKGELDELNRLISTGVVLSPSMEQYRQSLIDLTGQADGTILAQAQLTAALGEVGAAVTAIPNTRSVQITAPTEELKQRLKDLGFTVETIPGTKDVRVTAITEEAKGNIGALSGQLTNLDGQETKPVITADDNPLKGIIGADLGALANLGRQRPVPVASLNDGPLRSSAGFAHGVLNILGAHSANPVVSLFDGATARARAIQAVIDGMHGKTIVITTLQQGRTTTGAFAASGGNVGALVRGFAAGGMPSMRYPNGMLSGPGGPLDDLIPAITDMGELIRVANREWIINGAVSAQQGRDRMAMLNAGRADIVPRYADGGAPSGSGTRVTPSGSRVENLHVHINGTMDLTNRAGLRRMAVELKAMLDTIEREAR